MGLVPLIWVSFVRPPRVYWWLAVAFAVSFIADTFGHRFDPLTVSIVYPVSQAGIASLALLEKTRDRFVFLGALVWAGLCAVLLQDAPHPDLLLSTVAFGSLAAFAFFRGVASRFIIRAGYDSDRRQELAAISWPLVVYFGGGLLAWYAFAAWPSWHTYALYQTTRIAGLLYFCYAVWRPGPALKAA